MTAEEGKIDAIAGQLNDLRVGVANMSGDIRVLLSKVDDQARAVLGVAERVTALEDAGCRDYPSLAARVAALEASGVSEIPAIRTQLADLVRTKWLAFGLALGSGTVAGGVGTAISGLIQSGH